jgi:hypothetical protein
MFMIKKLLFFIALLFTANAFAQYNWNNSLSVYASAGITNFCKPQYDRMGTLPSGNAWFAGASYNLKSTTENAISFMVGLRYEDMKWFKIDYSSPGGTHEEIETNQQALYIQAAVIHKHFVNPRIFIPFGLHGNFLVSNKHSGYKHFRISGRDETFEYYSNTADPKRKPIYVFAAAGVGVKFTQNIQAETLIECGSSQNTAYKYSLGGSIRLSWTFGG